ncbi:ribosomal protein S18-alanine N-acetyltransferase [Oscillatoria sp. FACHB-1406]|uniref:ribosomal protein S18-alanine N-acetyltransferase n=1 Tax=Oscillatoria sp. FACHB-1406 TaxID=2692846 RepID=UPI001685D39D|nr:ribosomal protein S18-alanine N-acetyltransferase [Oscillatoria sp. FACHB-1406]MBD2577620.1 ribosomal protein S18-alanine N-acetyltransferase [Oscillatoria sp. FACHB-1406]
MQELILQPFSTAQLEAAVNLDRACLGGLWTLDGYQRELESPNSELLYLSVPVVGEGTFLGMGCFWAILEEAHITLLAVRPEFQGQGLGQALLLGLLKKAVERKLERATLEVRDSNPRAITLYEKFGFQLAGRRKGYYQDTGEDALIFWLGGLHREEFPQRLAQWEEKVEEKLHQHSWRLRSLC